MIGSGQAALARKVTTGERGGAAHISHRDTFSLGGGVSLSFFLSLPCAFRDECPSRTRLRLGCYTASVFPPCASPPRSGVFFDLSRPPSLQAPLLALFPYRCPPPPFFHNVPLAPSLVPRTPPLLLLLLQLLLLLLPAFLLLLLLRSCRSLLLISLVSTSQGPFSRRSLLLTERVLHSRPLSPRIVFT